MAKLVVCCDGTWQGPENRTHIFRINEAARRLVGPGNVFYDRGVGTRLGRLLLGGIAGMGLSENVREAYRWLLSRYEDGDEIYLFGFSRGAFTVRSLCGLVAHAGLLDPSDEAHVNTAWDAYRSHKSDKKSADAAKGSMHGLRTRKVKIHFVGVFDTVGALGIPINWIQQLLVRFRPRSDARFHDTRLRNVGIARQALAIDEHRGPFQPTLWHGSGDPLESLNVRQVWFAGTHADIGGGYEDKRLAEVPLVWMLREAAEAGLDLYRNFGVDPLFPNCVGCEHESMTAGYRLLHRLPSIRRYHRPIGRAQREWAAHRRFGGRWRLRAQRLEVPGEWVHCSVRERIWGRWAADLLPEQKRYAPVSLNPWPQDVPLLDKCPQDGKVVSDAAIPCPGCALRRRVA